MHSQSTATDRNTQDDSIPFGAPMSEHEMAVQSSGEHNSAETYEMIGGPYPQPGNCCAKCGEWEMCGGDNSADGTSTVACVSDKLMPCANVATCDCLIHPACGLEFNGHAGLCPCCHWLTRETQIERSRQDDLLECTAHYAANDVSRLRKMLASESDATKREATQKLLVEIAENALGAAFENRSEIVRSRLTPLPMAVA